MLRMYFIANWFNLSDVACEDALYDVPAFRDFGQFDLGHECVPDASTQLNFRHLLEQNDLGAAPFAIVDERLLANGLKLSSGTTVEPQFTMTDQEQDTNNRSLLRLFCKFEAGVLQGYKNRFKLKARALNMFEMLHVVGRFKMFTWAWESIVIVYIVTVYIVTVYIVTVYIVTVYIVTVYIVTVYIGTVRILWIQVG